MSRLFRAAGSIAGLTLVSRILGLWRDRLMAQVFGASWVQGTFLIAWMFPNLMRRLLGEGALSAALIPAYTAARKRDPEEAKALLAQVMGSVTALLLPLCLVVAAVSLVMPAEWLPAPEKGGVAAMRLLLSLNAVLFAYALPVCLCAVLSGALNTMGRFALPAATPVLLNVFWIAALLVAKPLGYTVDVDIANFAAWWLAIGGFLQLVFLALPMWAAGQLPRVRLCLPKRGTPAWAVFAAMGPMVLGMSLNQVSSLLDQLMAYYLVSSGAPTYIYLANRLLLFPHALTAMSLGVAAFPKLALEATETDRRGMRASLDQFAGQTVLVTLPASAGLMVLAEDIVRVLFLGGEFTEADVGPQVLTVSCLVAGLPFLGLAQLYARAFYAVGDARAPAGLAARLVVLNAVLNLVLVLTTPLGTAALALSSSLSSVANAVFLARWFHRHVPAAEKPTLPSAWLRSCIATAVMGAVVWFTRTAAPGASHTQMAMRNVVVPIVAGMVAYVLVLIALRSPEFAGLRRRRGR